MAIVPNSTIQLYGDVGLKPNQEDTIYFPDEATKTSWFNSNSRPLLGTFSNQYYTRKANNVLRIAPSQAGATIHTIYNAQYLRFKNTAYENKWFYAFVISVDYVNDSVVDVTFAIDIMTTWMGCFELKPCYIARQHTTSDGIGSNTVEENLDIGEHVCEARHRTALFNSYYIGVWWSYDPSFDSGAMNIQRQGTYVPVMCAYYTMDAQGFAAIDQLLNQSLTVDQKRPDAVINMKLVPYAFADPQNQDSTSPTFYSYSVTKPYTNFMRNNNYSPKNKKLYTYPYKYLNVENCEGESVNFKYEYFNVVPPVVANSNQLECDFRIRGTACTPEVSIMTFPHNYSNKDWDYSKALDMTKFPTCAWNIDTYKAYIAQRDSTILGNLANSAFAGGASGLLHGGVQGGLVGTAGGLVNGVASSGLIRDVVNDLTGNSKYIMTNETRGRMDSNILVQSKQKDFYFNEMCITPEKMRMIDDYFTMYGYAIKEIKTPTINVRRHFTYVKTIGCNISPISNMSIPASDASAIEDMFNSGRRFWQRNSTVGDYTQDNSVAS